MGRIKSKMYLKYATLAAITAEIVSQAGAIKTWKSGELVSNDTFTYGKFIAKAKTDDKLGTCSSFFTFWKGNSQESWAMSNWS